MNRYYFDMVCSLYHTEVIEANSQEEAQEIYDRLQESEAFDAHLVSAFLSQGIGSQDIECSDIGVTAMEVTLADEDLRRYGVERDEATRALRKAQQER